MITKRIQNIDINNRGPYTALYGNIDDLFLGEDMKMYLFDQQMYLYLKSAGFDIVVFHSQKRGFYSFQEAELLSFVKMKTKQPEPTTTSFDNYKSSSIIRPLGGKAKAVSSPRNEESSHPSPVALKFQNEESFFQAKKDSKSSSYDYVEFFLNARNTKIALVAMSPNISKFERNDDIEGLFYDKNNGKYNFFKIIVTYAYKNADDLIQEFRNNQDSNKTFFSPFFRGQFTQGGTSDRGHLTDNCIEIPLPEPEEINRWVHYNRLIKGLNFNLSKSNVLLKRLQAKRMTANRLKNLIQNDLDKILSTSARDELNKLIGLHSVKEAIDKLVSYLELHKERQSRGITDKDAAFNLSYIFMGNPGTGKTTVARLLGQILAEIEVLEHGHSVEVTREDLVAGYVGQTAIKTKAKIDEAVGGVLFIDEAYSLTNKGENDFGQEAMETLLAAMTNPKYQGKMAFVVAGYPVLMYQFLDSNPGLSRRFTQFIHFEDYSSVELTTIFEKKLESLKFMLEANAKEKATLYFESLPRGKSFGNAGVADTLASQAIDNLNIRLKNAKKSLKDLSTLELTTIQTMDIPEPIKASISTVGQKEIETEPQKPTPTKTSLADEILLNDEPNNNNHVFIRQVCDEIEEVLTQTIAAYQGEADFEAALRSLENEFFKKRVEAISKYEAEIDKAQLHEIKAVMEAFRLFFRGILSVNQNDIPSAIKHFNASIPLAKANQIEGLEQTTIFLAKYWAIFLSVQDGDFTLVQSKLNDLKNDVELSGVNEHYRQMSDLMQADILFISALKALGESDISRFTDLANQAAESTDKVVGDYFSGYNNPDAALLSALAYFYRALADMVLLFYKIDQEDFNLTRELSSLGINATRAQSNFEKVDVESNVRMANVYYLVQSFAVFESFLRELSIVMINYKDHGRKPAEESLIKLKTLGKEAQQSLLRIKEESLKPWVEMCDEMIEYVSKLEQGEYQPAMSHDFSKLADNQQGFANETANELLDYTNVEVVKKRTHELLVKGRNKEAIDILEKHLPSVTIKEVYDELLLMINQFWENRRRWDYKLVSHQDGTVDERSILAAIISIIRQL